MSPHYPVVPYNNDPRRVAAGESPLPLSLLPSDQNHSRTAPFLFAAGGRPELIVMGAGHDARGGRVPAMRVMGTSGHKEDLRVTVRNDRPLVIVFYKPSAAAPNIRMVRPMEAAARSDMTTGVIPMFANLPPEHLVFAGHAGGPNVRLRFADGRSATVNLAGIEINVSRLRLNTVRHSPDGSAMEVRDKRGRTIHIDSAVLRSQCDLGYAAELRQAIADLAAHSPIRRISAERQHRLDYLMDKNNEGQLSDAEQEEFQAMVRELEQLTIDNARRLAAQA